MSDTRMVPNELERELVTKVQFMDEEDRRRVKNEVGIFLGECSLEELVVSAERVAGLYWAASVMSPPFKHRAVDIFAEANLEALEYYPHEKIAFGATHRIVRGYASSVMLPLDSQTHLHHVGLARYFPIGTSTLPWLQW